MPKPKNVRSRTISPFYFGEYLWQYILPDNIFRVDSKPAHSLAGTQYTVSEGHHWPPPKGGGFSDQGGEFFTTKSEIINERFPRVAIKDPPENSAPIYYLFTGDLMCYLPTTAGVLDYPPQSLSSKDDLMEKGATAIARCSPTNSPADLATFLGELVKDGLPSAIGSTWKNTTDRARKKGADEYLNIQFGWLPLFRDMKKVADSIVHAESVLAQFERDAGKMVRRKYRFSSEKHVEETSLGIQSPLLSGVGVSALAQHAHEVVRTRETVREISFSGGFTYHLPSGYDSRNKMTRTAARASHLLGAKPTPDVIWNIAPWSWAVDWFANVGDVLKNVTNFVEYGLILRYGYITETVTVTDTYSQVPGTGSPGAISAAPCVLRTKSIQRFGASPFGFGVNWDGLSSFQLSILAALGISKRG